MLAVLGCSAITGGVEKDSVEAAREARAVNHAPEKDAAKSALLAEGPVVPPKVDVHREGFDHSGFGSAADVAAESAVIVGLAAAIVGLVRLYQRHLPLLGFLVALAALFVGLAAFFSAAT
jgi:hypothetical protein